MPIFYHFTSVIGFQGILRSERILPGDVCVAPGEVKPRYAVCLTSDESPDGHGLPDGREISRCAVGTLRANYSVGDKVFSDDHTMCRFKILVPENESALIHFPLLFADDPKYLKVLEVGGYLPCGEWEDPQALLMVWNCLEKGVVRGKSQTWWIYRGEIPFDWFVDVGAKVEGGDYVCVAPEEARKNVLDGLRER